MDELKNHNEKTLGPLGTGPTASTAVKGYGATLSYSTDGTTFTAIAQTVDLPGPQPEVGDVNITNNSSPSNTKEYIPGMIEPGTYDFKIVYNATIAGTVYGLMDATTVYTWKVVFIDASNWTFKGFVKSFKVTSKTEDGRLEADVSIKGTNKPVFSAT